MEERGERRQEGKAVVCVPVVKDEWGLHILPSWEIP